MYLEEAGRRKYYLAFALTLGAVLVAYANHHFARLATSTSELVVINAFGFCWLAFTLVSSHLHKDSSPSVDARIALKKKRVTVVVPLHNEDPKVFSQLLDSVLQQTRRVNRIHVVDNGSSQTDCQDIFIGYLDRFEALNIEAEYTVVGKIGKRGAQVIAFDADPDADYYVTLDSDTILDTRAVEEGCLPFSDPRVTSVAGLLLSLNYNKNLLTRLVDLSYVMSFLNGRASWSRLGSVVVNCGGLAVYRGDVIHKYKHKYLTQTIWGRQVMFGDDRMLTCYALLEGRTVIQEGSMGYTLQPENLNHLTRQRIRWWRSFFWGGGWLIQTFPLRKPAFWLVLTQFMTFMMYSFALPYILIVHPIQMGGIAWVFFGYMALLSYIRSVRYLIVRRPDQSLIHQWLIYLMSPLSAILMFYLASVLQYIGLFTFLKTGWGTRQTVEVKLD